MISNFKNSKFSLVIIAINCLILWVNPVAAQPEDHAFISIADIHFDPYIECKKSLKKCPLIDELRNTNYKKWDETFAKYKVNAIGGYYQDTSYPLFKSAILNFKKINLQIQPQFVIILGDFLGHSYFEKFKRYSSNFSSAAYADFVKKTFQFMAYEFQTAFPNTNVYFTIGNNDSYTGDYTVIPQGLFLKDISNMWSELIKDKRNQTSFKKTFPQAGYYAVNVNQNKLIILNSVLFSVNPKLKKLAVQKAALAQLKWLQQELLDAQQNNQKVILAFHIPFGVDLFATIQHNFTATEFWRHHYNTALEGELLKFSAIITAIMPAHIHIETFQHMVLKEVGDIPINLTPSISPIFGNDPGFKVFFYDEATFKINKIETDYYKIKNSALGWQQASISNQ